MNSAAKGAIMKECSLKPRSVIPTDMGEDLDFHIFRKD
jgi:hypothetical protein